MRRLRLAPLAATSSAAAAVLEHPAARPQLVVSPPSRAPARVHGRFDPHRLASEPFLCFFLPFLAYLTCAALLDFAYHSWMGDAVSRMANAFYVLHSGDPHLAAMGFVWNPLTSAVQLPILLFNSLWPALAQHAFSAGLSSAWEMAGAVYQLRCTLNDWGVRRAPRLVLTVLFAIDPMILFFGGNGMSEALYLLTMTMTTRYLLRWLRRGDLISLVYAAAALGLGYLARNEAVLSAFFGGLTVLAITFLGTAGVLRQRLAAALTDFVIFLAPVVTSFAAWAVASYVITKQWFAQFSSMYGTTSQLKIAPNSVTTHSGRLIEEVKGIEALAPLLVVMLVIAVVLAWRRRDLAVLAPITVLGGGLAFDFSEYFLNNLAWSLRYYILSIPLGILLTGALFADLPPVRASWTTPSYRLRRVAAGDRPPPRVHRWAIGLAGAVVAFLLVLPTLPTTVEAMGNSQLGSLELQGLGFIFHSPPDAADRGYADHWQHVKDMDDYLESLHLGNGQVLMDNFPGCAPDLIIESDDPRMFVIPNDRDFQRTLAAPITFNAHYMMLPAPTGLNGLDAISDEYPRMYENGAGIATLVHTFLAGGACSAWRLYHVYKTASTTS